MNIKELRNHFHVSVAEAAKACGLPIRTFCRYEADDQYGKALVRQTIIERINKAFKITEETGVLSLKDICSIVGDVCDEYEGAVEFAVLFGSYAKGLANQQSDVDLVVSAHLEGIYFVGLIEKLRVALHKKVDLIRLDTLKDNVALVRELLKDGIKIYDYKEKRHL